MPVVVKTETDHLTAIIEPDERGVVISCPELDLATQGATVEEAWQDLIEMAIDYAEQYREQQELFIKSPNRALHAPYIDAIERCGDDRDAVKNLFVL